MTTHNDDTSPRIESFLSSHGSFEKPPTYMRGTHIGDWTVLAFLGRGGSSEVYRAENLLTGQIGAVKILLHDEPRLRARFRREVKLLTKTQCVAFPRFYGAGEHEGKAYLVIEPLEPVDLPSDDSSVARFVIGVCVGVEVLHRLGYVHRDIKPKNVMRRPETGEPVLIDMGLVKESSELPNANNETISVVDGHAVGIGTPGFSAPEQFAGGAIGSAADIHALGMLANACFDGHPPKPWTSIIRQSTSSIPAQRYATVEQFVQAIRRRNWKRHVLFAILVMLALVLIAMPCRKLFGQAQPQAPSVQTVPTWRQIDEKAGTSGETITEIRLEKRDLRIEGEVVLDGNRKVLIRGPGRMTASISGTRDVTVEVRGGATLVNLTRKPYPESGIKYVVEGACGLVFPNLPKTTRTDNIWADDSTISDDIVIRHGN